MMQFPKTEALLQNIKLHNENRYDVLHEEMDIVIHKLKFISIQSRPRVLFISDVRTDSQDFGVHVEELLEIAGGVWLDKSDAVMADKIVFFSSSSTLYSDIPVLLTQQEYENGAAVKNNEIYIIQNEKFGSVDADQLLTDLEILAEICQPKYFIYGHEGNDWVSFDLGTA